ncbi:YbaN family protein [Thermaurantiacus sp.]
MTAPLGWTPARLLYLVLGAAALALGLVGVVVPLLPTTPFLILAAFGFARSSPRLEAWLLTHPRFGPALRAWRNRQAIPPAAKRASALGMALGFCLFWAWRAPQASLLLLVAGMMLLVSAWIWTRPN